jgi:Type IV secretion system pilin
MPTPTEVNIDGAAILVGIPGTETGETPNAGFARIVGNILEVVMIISLLLLLYFLVIGAIEWITAAGDKGKIEAARNKMTNAFIGIIILASVVALFTFVQGFLGVEVLLFASAAASGQIAVI